MILPVLDEAGALPGVLGGMPAGYRAIVVDNGSTDGSGQIARELGATVIDEPAKGFGSACFAGLVASEADVICFMDCDGSLDPADLPRLEAELSRGADLVMGYRDAQRGAWPPHARFANRALAFELRRRTGLQVKDIGPMRVMYRQKLLNLGMTDRRSGWPLEMVIKANAAGWNIEEIPVKLHPRSGKSKVTGTLKGTMQAIRDMSDHLRTLT